MNALFLVLAHYSYTSCCLLKVCVFVCGVSLGYSGSGGVWGDEGAVHALRRRLLTGVCTQRPGQVMQGECVCVCACVCGDGGGGTLRGGHSLLNGEWNRHRDQI